MKLEVGMYVRFKTLSNEVKIGQIQLIDNIIYELDNNEVTADKYIIKASHTLLGNNKEPCLIEVGDYVNGYKVIDMQNLICFNANPGKPLLGIEAFNDYWELVEIDIKSIVTKEQFEQMQYKVDN